jgi:LmbE family N-acetylglucosaminyl deacetylase
MRSGCEIWYAIASLSPSGVEEGYGRGREEKRTLSSQEWKREIRRREQVRAAASFGLGSGRLAFLNIGEEGRLDSGENSAKIRGHLEAVAPDVVIMPVGGDQNRTHAWVHRVFRDCAQDLADRWAKPLVAFYNEDPKTVEIRSDLFVVFGEESAAWKGALLRAHDSQQQRNLRTRGTGLDERILRMNHLSWQRLLPSPAHAPSSERYAEVFEIEPFAPAVSR